MKMKHSLKRLAAYALCFAMLLTAMPFGAMATEELVYHEIMRNGMMSSMEEYSLSVVDGESKTLDVLPMETEYGIALSAIDLCEIMGFGYELDTENKAFYIYAEDYEDVILVHNATEFASGDNVYPCLPYFYYTNGEPMVDVAFFCEMYNCEYNYDSACVSFELVPAAKEEKAEAYVVFDGEKKPLSIVPFKDEIGLSTSAEDMANAFGIDYSYDEKNGAVLLYDEEKGELVLDIDLTHFSSKDGEFDCAPFLTLDDDGIPVVEIGIFCKLFGAEYEYDEETKTVTVYRHTIKDDKGTFEDEASLMSGGTLSGKVMSCVGPFEEDTDVELYIMQVFVGRNYDYLYGEPYYSNTYRTKGNVYRVDTVTIEEGESEAEFDIDVSDYYTRHPQYYYYDEYRTDYALFYVVEEFGEYGYYGSSSLLNVHPTQLTTYINAPFSFSDDETAEIYVGRKLPKSVYGTIERSRESAECEVEMALYFVNIGASYDYGYYGSSGSSYIDTYAKIEENLGTVTLPAGETSVDYRLNFNKSGNFSVFFKIYNSDNYGYVYNNYGTNYVYQIGDTYRDIYYSHATRYNFMSSRQLDINFGDSFEETELFEKNTSDYSCEIDSMGRLTFEGNDVVFTSTVSIPWLSAYEYIYYARIGNGIKKIGTRYFDECYNLRWAKLADGVQEIGTYSFRDCISLERIEIPESVTKISSTAFVGCENLVIYGSRGSYAEEYALENGIPFVDVESGAPNPNPTPTPTPDPDEPDEPDEPVQPEAVPGRVILTADKKTATPGSTVTVDIKLSASTGFAGMAYDVVFDSSILTLTGITTDIGAASCTHSSVDRYENKANFQYVALSNITGNGILATLTFTVAEDAEEGLSAITVVPNLPSCFYYGGANGQKEIDLSVESVSGGVDVRFYEPGDITGDGVLNNRDAARLMQFLAGWDVTVVESLLDVTGDGVVNNRDAARIMQYLAGWNVELH